jgi:hypothetical protein
MPATSGGAVAGGRRLPSQPAAPAALFDCWRDPRKPRGVRIALAAVVVAVALSSVAAAGPTCRTSFLGCRTRPQKIRFCRAACVTTRTVCKQAFRSSRLKVRCTKRALRVCVSEGGSCIHACDAGNPCPAGQQCVAGRCIMAEPCQTPCGDGCCGGDYPNCGPDGRCWTKPCESLCGTSCCGGKFPNCGPDDRCWSKPCETLCGKTCCGGATPVCDAGTCQAGSGGGGGDGFPTNLPPGTYSLVICISGTVSLPCQGIGSIPFQSLAQFEAAIGAAFDQWLAATAGTPDCSRGAATYSAFDGSQFTATATATCGEATETLKLTVRHE